MPSISPLSDFSARDPTWAKALEIVQGRLKLSASVWSLIRSAWNGSLSQREYVHMLGFSRLNLTALIDAAGLRAEQPNFDASLLERALQNLGMRYSAVILGISYCCEAVLAKKPPPLWRRMFQEMMTCIHVGYLLGSKVITLGVEGGALVGFAQHAGSAVLLVHNPAEFKKWYHTKPEGLAPFPRDKFGCEPYQVSAFVLQQLGFGHEVAIGAALGSGKTDFSRLEIDERTKAWQAAYLWVEALREGRNYPANPAIRQVFPEIAPPKDSSSPPNLNLEVLYTEVAKIRSAESPWTWHLPRPSYSDTAELIDK